jgi:hypothetical protein
VDIISDLGPTEIARMVGCRAPSVVEWRKRGIPPDRCVALERATAGRYTCEGLRGDVSWIRVPDPAWPHPGGRPCIDVAAPKAEEARDAA